MDLGLSHMYLTDSCAWDHWLDGQWRCVRRMKNCTHKQAENSHICCLFSPIGVILQLLELQALSLSHTFFFSIWTCAQARTEFRLEGSDSEDDPGAFLQWTTYETVCAMHLKDWFCIYSAWRHGGSGLTKLKTYDLQMLTKNGLKKWLEMSSKTLKKMSMIFVLPRKVGPNNKMEHTCEAMKSWTLRSALLTLRRAEVPQVTWIVFYMIACWMLFW